MLTIFYSMAGEGRGHAARALTITEALRTRHYRLHLFAPAQAYDFLEPVYRNTEVKITQIPELVFQYTAQGRVAYLRTCLHMLHYVMTRRQRFQAVAQAFVTEQPDLVLVDFEPGLPRLANQFGVPWVSLDHQNFLRTYDLSSLPRRLRWHLGYMQLAVSLYGSRPHHRIVSSFYFPPLRPGLRAVTQVGTLFRDSVRLAKTQDAGHITVYLRRALSANVQEALRNSGRTVHVFTAQPQADENNLHFFAITPDHFIESLCQCSMLLTTAGNQLLGEALYLGKPVLVMPEPSNPEQEINGHFLHTSGGGCSVPMEQLNAQILQTFLQQAHSYRLPETERQRLDGLPKTLEVLEGILESIAHRQGKSLRLHTAYLPIADENLINQ